MCGVLTSGEVQTGVTVMLPHGPVRHSLTFLGSISMLSSQMLDKEALKRARHFHLSSLFLQTALQPGLIDLLHELRDAGLSISLDTNDDPSNAWGYPLQDLLPLVDLFMPNESELCRMAGNVSLEEAVRSFAPDLPVMVIKRGRQGCRVRAGNLVFDVQGVPVIAVDTIGAGDSFDAGFLFAYLGGHGLKACAAAGNITGAWSTRDTGGTESFRDRSGLQAFLKLHGFPGSAATATSGGATEGHVW